MRRVNEPVVLVQLVESVLWITINRPERRNAMSFEVMAGVLTALHDARVNDNVRVVVITGAGDRAFCAGADLASIADNTSFAELHQGRGQIAEIFLALWELGKPTVARVRGFALAGGFGLACACDIVVASEDSTFGTPEIDVGLWPYMITVPLLRSLPAKTVLELMMTGRRMDAFEAQRLGCVTQVVSVEALDATVRELTQTLASKPPLTMKWGRDSFYRTLQQSDARAALDHLQTMLTLTTNTEDAAEGVAAFAEKRTPRWTGR